MTELIRVPKEKLYILRLMLKNVKYPFIRSALEGQMGNIYTDSLDNPTICHVNVGIYNLFMGDTRHELAPQMIQGLYPRGWVVNSSKEWMDLICRQYGQASAIKTRYSFKRADFNINMLQKAASQLPSGYTLERMELDLANEASKQWCKGLVRYFDSPEDFYMRGIGFCILHAGKIVAGASSHSILDKGIEVQLMTREDHRKKGLATAVAAKLILHCLQNDLFPYWDAANEVSFMIATKLGYKLSFFYKAILVEYPECQAKAI